MVCFAEMYSPLTTAPRHCERSRQIPWTAAATLISAPLFLAASINALVSRRLSTEASCGRSTAASISSLNAGSISRASFAEMASAFNPSPRCSAMMVFNSSRACREKSASTVPFAR